MKLLALALAALVWLAPPLGGGQGGGEASAQDLLRIVAVVNDEVISERDLRERLRLVAVTSGLEATVENQRRLAPQVLRGLIQERLQLQEARRLNLAVEDEEIERAFATIAQQNNMQPEQLRQALAASGVSPEALRRQIEAQLAWLKVIAREIRPRVTVTEAQIEQAVQQQLRSRGQTEYLLSEILLPVDDPSQAEIARRDAERLVEALRGGAAFEALARQFSAAASAEDGGDVGWVPATAIPPELRSTIDALAEGGVTQPLRSNVGYHLFMLRDRRTPLGRADADVRVTLAQIFLPVSNGADEGELAELQAQAAALRPRLDDCAAMNEVAEEIGAPSSGTIGTLRVSELPPELGRAALALPVGQVSQPLRGPSGIHLLMVCERGEEGLAAAQVDREQVAERLEQEQMQRLARRYLRDLQTRAFIDVRADELLGPGAIADTGGL